MITYFKMTEHNRPIVNNKTKVFFASIFAVFYIIVILSVYFVNHFILPIFNIKINEWWILLLISINIILTVLTEMFRFDDSTGGYQSLLDNLKMGTFVFITFMMIVMKQYNVISITNKTLLVFVLIFNLILIVIKNMVRNYLSHIHSKKMKQQW